MEVGWMGVVGSSQVSCAASPNESNGGCMEGMVKTTGA